MPDVSIVIPSWNTRELLAVCLASVAGDAGAVEVIVVDNASTDGSPEMVRERFPEVRLLANTENRGFGAAANQGARAAAAPRVLVLNSDARPLPGAVAALCSLLDMEPRAALVGARLLHGDGSFQASHAPFPSLWREMLILSGLGRAFYGPWYPSHGPRERGAARVAEYVGGACMMLRRSAFEEVGGFDEGYFMYAEEVDLCRRLAERGWQVWYEPAAAVLHAGSASSRARSSQREADLYAARVRYFRKHHGDAAAAALKAMVYAFTAAKIASHGFLRRLTGGRRGRRVVRVADLRLALRRT